MIPQELIEKLRPWQVPIVENSITALKGGNFLNASGLGTGKCHRKGDRVLMFDGSIKTVESLCVGDRLMGDDSAPRTILSLATGIDEIFRIAPLSGGEPFFVNRDHVLCLKISPRKKGQKHTIVEISLTDYLASKRKFKDYAKLYRVAVDFPARALGIDPYWLGLWLGDGNSHNASITTMDQVVVDCQSEMAEKWGLDFVTLKKHRPNKAATYALSRKNLHERHPLYVAMSGYGLLNGRQKHIPNDFLFNSRENRLALLSGILDSDGHRSGSGSYEVISVHKHLAEQYCFLARSLGFMASIAPKIGRIKSIGFSATYWRVNISGANQLPMRVPHKQSPEPRKQKKNQLVTGFQVQSVGVDQYFGFTLDGNGRYLMADFTVTHNTFCSIAAASVLQMPVLAIGRIAARSTWLEVADHFGYPKDQLQTINREMLRTGRSKFGVWEFGEGDHNSGKRSKNFRWKIDPRTLLIFDEVHHDSGAESLNSKVLRAAVKQGLTILMLSGTAADDPRKMRAIGYALGLHQDSNFYPWLYSQGATVDSWTCGMSDQQLAGPRGKQALEIKRKAIMAKIHRQLRLAGRFVHLPTSEIPNFPRCSVQPVKVDFNDGRIGQLYEQMNQELAVLKAKSGNPRAQQLEILIRLRQQTELLEVPGLVDEVNEGIEEGQSVVVFLNFVDSVKALAERLQCPAVFVGTDSPEVREQNRLRFERDDARVMVVSKSAGSESVSFADRRGEFPRLGLVIPGFHAQMENQVMGRLPRDGAKSPSIYRILFAAGTVEEAAYLSVKRKTDRFDAFNLGITDSDLMAGLNL